MAATATAEAPRNSAGRRLAGFLWRRPKLSLGLLLAGPIGWLVIAYLGSLAVLFAASFWHLDTFSGQVVQGFGLDNFKTLVTEDVYRSIVLRTVLIAAAVTVTDAILAFPIAFFMAKLASTRTRALLVIAVVGAVMLARAKPGDQIDVDEPVPGQVDDEDEEVDA